jgi:predicted hydrocarbon binding protein
MLRNAPRAPELALPTASLRALRRALVAEVGADAAARGLQHAGHAAGDALYPLLQPAASASSGGAVSDMGTSRFWRRVSELFASRGWGRLKHEAPHPGVGALTAEDWVEADPDSGATRPSCFFTSGLLANLLGRAADAQVSVLEVHCRSRGDRECRFLFGSDESLYTVYESLRSGHDVERSLAQLT